MGFLAAPVVGSLTVGGVIATGAAVVGTAMQIQAAREAAKAEEERAKYQREVALRNAAIEEENRVAELHEAALAAQDADQDAKIELGALLADQGASGLDLGSGSFLRVRQGMETIAAQDRSRIIKEGENAADEASRRAENFREEARNAGRAADNARSAGRRSVAASLISGIGTISNTAAKHITGSAREATSAVERSLRPRTRIVV